MKKEVGSIGILMSFTNTPSQLKSMAQEAKLIWEIVAGWADFRELKEGRNVSRESISNLDRKIQGKN
jgi:hypothetical protein